MRKSSPALALCSRMDFSTIDCSSTQEDVAENLKETLNIPQEFSDIFIQNYIDGEEFMLLTKEDLCKMIQPTGIYCKIWRYIQKLNGKDKTGEQQQQNSASSHETSTASAEPSIATVQSQGTEVLQQSGEWLSAALIPDHFSPRVSRFLSGEVEVLGRSMRTEIVNTLYSRMIQNTYTPTSKDYNAVCQLLVHKFPKLQDEDPKYPYNTWKQQLRWKFKNARRTGNDTRKRSSKKQAIEELLEDDEYEGMVSEIKKAWKQKKKRHSVVKDLMIKTFSNRRSWILREPSVSEVIDKFPCLERINYLEQELKQVADLEVPDDVMIEWPMWRDKVLAYVDEEKTTLKRLLKVEQKYSADKERLKHIDGSLEDLRDFFAIQCLQSLLSYRTDKQIVYTFSDTITVEDMTKAIVFSEPCLVRFLSDMSNRTYHVTIEGRMLNKIESVKKAILALISAYYVFNISYPPILSATLVFLQHYVMNIQFEKKLPLSVSTLGSNLSRIVL